MGILSEMYVIIFRGGFDYKIPGTHVYHPGGVNLAEDLFLKKTMLTKMKVFLNDHLHIIFFLKTTNHLRKKYCFIGNNKNQV